MSALQRSVLIVTLGFLLLLLRSVVWRAVALGPFTPQLVLPMAIFLGVSPDVRLVRGADAATDPIQARAFTTEDSGRPTVVMSSSVAAVGAAQVGRKSMVGSLAVRVLPSLRRQIHLPSQRHHRPPPDIAQPP